MPVNFLFKPGDVTKEIRRGTFTAPADIPFDQIKAILNATWAKKWVEVQEDHGFHVCTDVRVERDPIPEIGDVFLGITDTFRYRYNMTAGFEAVLKQIIIEDVPDHIAAALVAESPRYSLIDSKRMI